MPLSGGRLEWTRGSCPSLVSMGKIIEKELKKPVLFQRCLITSNMVDRPPPLREVKRETAMKRLHSGGGTHPICNNLILIL